MKKAFAFSFLVILLLNTAGYFISFSIERYKIREEAEQLLKHDKKRHARVFVFSLNQFEQLRRYENNKEFTLHGSRYDVVSIKKNKGKIIVSAVYDKKETVLKQPTG